MLKKFHLKGEKMATYTCKYCGWQTSNAGSASYPCNYSPHKHHEWMNATEKLSQYTCKFCGWQTSNSSSASYPCSSSPHKTHEWLG